MKKIFIASAAIMALALFAAIPGFCDYEPDWEPISGNQYNMVLFGNLYLNDQKVDSSNYVLAAFGPKGNSDCRAVTWIGAVGEGFYMTVRGNQSGETIQFRVFDTDTGDTYAAVESISFYPNETRSDFALNITQEEIPDPKVDEKDDAEEVVEIIPTP